MDPNLVIDDSYVEEVGRLCKIRGNKFEEILDEYITILSEIENEAILGGTIVSSLITYKECVQILNDEIKTVSSGIKDVCNGFIVAVNEADEYLF